MEPSESESSIIFLFAQACEELIDFAVSLRGRPEFANVTTGADIRNYKSGWPLEKWIEAEIVGSDGAYAVWWLELGSPDGKSWCVDSYVGISPEGEDFPYPDRLAHSVLELREHLSATV